MTSGSLPVTAKVKTLVSYWTLACLLASVYGFLQGAWPFGIVEAIWSLVAVHRWWQATKVANLSSGS